MIYLWGVGVRGCVEVPSLYVLRDETLLSKEVESKALLRFSHIRVNLLFLLCRGFFHIRLFLLCRGFFHIRLSLLCRGFFHIRLILFLLLCRREKRRAGGEKGKEEMEGRKRGEEGSGGREGRKD